MSIAAVSQCHIFYGLGCCFVSSWSHAAQQERIWCCFLCMLHVVLSLLCNCFHCVNLGLLRLSFSSLGLVVSSPVPSWFDNFVSNDGLLVTISATRLEDRKVLPDSGANILAQITKVLSKITIWVGGFLYAQHEIQHVVEQVIDFWQVSLHGCTSWFRGA